MIEAALAILEPRERSVDYELAEGHAQLAALYGGRGDAGRARRHAREAFELIRDDQDDSWMYAMFNVRIARGLLSQRLYDEAERLLVPAHRVLDSAFGAGNANTEEARRLLVRLYEQWERPERAAEYAAAMP
jgi:hypothetical protein